jgi:hypothetical protein
MRTFQYYTTTAGESVDFWQPRIEMADGTEMPVQSLLAMGAVSASNPINNANVTTFISGAAIGYAQIGSVDAGTITVGQLTAGQIQAGAVTAANGGSYSSVAGSLPSTGAYNNTFNSLNGGSPFTLTTTGSSVNVMVDIAVSMELNFGTIFADWVGFIFQLKVDGAVSTLVSENVRVLRQAPTFNYCALNSVIKARLTGLSAGSHTFSLSVVATAYNHTGSTVDFGSSGTFNFYTYTTAFENKV